MFSIEKASADRKGLQQAVDRIVAIIQASPDKERIDNIITRWLKRYLQRLGAKANLDQLTSLMEDKDMLAENLENWAQQERQAGIEKGTKLGIEQGTKLGIEKTARNLLKLAKGRPLRISPQLPSIHSRLRRRRQTSQLELWRQSVQF